MHRRPVINSAPPRAWGRRRRSTSGRSPSRARAASRTWSAPTGGRLRATVDAGSSGRRDCRAETFSDSDANAPAAWSRAVDSRSRAMSSLRPVAMSAMDRSSAFSRGDSDAGAGASCTARRSRRASSRPRATVSWSARKSSWRLFRSSLAPSLRDVARIASVTADVCLASWASRLRATASRSSRGAFAATWNSRNFSRRFLTSSAAASRDVDSRR